MSSHLVLISSPFFLISRNIQQISGDALQSLIGGVLFFFSNSEWEPRLETKYSFAEGPKPGLMDWILEQRLSQLCPYELNLTDQTVNIPHLEGRKSRKQKMRD